MRCPFCENEYSDSVLPFHTAGCQDVKKAVAPDLELVALREKAKELGIKSPGSKKREALEKEIAEIEAKAKE